jgi:branched-chain amino acid aminotransferase
MANLTPTDWIWRDGEFVPWADATLHVLSHSMQFGSAAFEGIRAYATPTGPAIFRLREHLQRLVTSVRIYRMELDYTVDQLVDATVETVARNGLDSCYIRPMIVRGFGAAGMVPTGSPIHVYIPVWPWGTYLGPEALERGIAACISSWHRVAPNTIPAMAKIAGNYLSGQLIKMEALANGYDEAIALSPGGTVSEGSGQNVFAVVDGILHTTPLDGTILGGITRASMIQLAKDAGYEVREGAMARETLYGAQELFICGTASEVTPVTSVDRIRIGTGTVGPITRDLQSRYMDIVTGRAPDTHGWLTHVRRA